MKATGIVRRIDDLGRIVIPKEIRRTLHIRESDPVEIFTDREECLFIPPLNVSKAIEYLQTNYGIYDSHYNLFFD